MVVLLHQQDALNTLALALNLVLVAHALHSRGDRTILLVQGILGAERVVRQRVYGIGGVTAVRPSRHLRGLPKPDVLSADPTSPRDPSADAPSASPSPSSRPTSVIRTAPRRGASTGRGPPTARHK
eukprot:scaffold5847_cov417-Prasinococcus_capsulatus_cf.AAC.1